MKPDNSAPKPRTEYPFGNPHLFQPTLTPRRDWFNRLWDFIMRKRA